VQQAPAKLFGQLLEIIASIKEEQEMKRTLLVTTALATAIFATAAWGQATGRQGRPGPGGPGGPGMSCPAMAVTPPQSAMLERMADQLQLTDEQSTKLNEVITKNQQTMTTLSQKAAEATKALRTAVLASEFDVQKVKDLATAAEKAEAAVIAADIDEWAQIRSILTADQITTMREMTSKQGTRQAPSGPPPDGDGQAPPPPDGDGQAPPPPPGQ